MFNYEHFEEMVEQTIKSYREARPYPFCVLDGLFDQKGIDAVNLEIDKVKFKTDVRSIEGQEIKTRSDFEDNESLPPKTKQIFDVLNGGKFLKVLSRLTGIDGLISDPYYDGGGVNIINNGGTLAVHVDGTMQHRMQICRRLNVILFLNDFWDKDWNGYHEQWDYLDKNLSPFDPLQKWKCVRKILPKQNRLLVFTTNDHSWHGHAGVLDVPEDVERKSLIAYYYTSSRPDNDLLFGDTHRALFIDNKKTVHPAAFQDTEVLL